MGQAIADSKKCLASPCMRTRFTTQGVFDWGELLSGRSTANVKSLYSKVIPAEEINIMQIPPELLDFMTSLTLKNGSPFTTTVKGSFAGGTNTDGGEVIRKLSHKLFQFHSCEL